MDVQDLVDGLLGGSGCDLTYAKGRKAVRNRLNSLDGTSKKVVMRVFGLNDPSLLTLPKLEGKGDASP